MIKQIPLFKVFMSPDIMKPLEDVLYSGFIGEGECVVRFEKQVSEKFNEPYVLTMNSGTSVLHIIYQMLANGDENSEAIVSPMTCSATLTPLIANGIKIIWADIDPKTGNIDPLDVERKITNNTKMIIAVHWGGIPCDMDKLNKLTEKYNIPIVQDGAHSLGAIYNGKHISHQSDFIMFSLQAIKHITSIDGGIFICKDEKYYDRAKLLRWYGISREVDAKQTKDLRCELDISEAGHKFHMNNINAVVGSENFKHLDDIVNLHRGNALYYNHKFENKVETIKYPDYVNPSFWLYTILFKDVDWLMERLKEDEIMSSRVHASNTTHSMFREYYSILPGVEKFNKEHLCIPVHWAITEEEREYIAERVIYYVKNYAN